MRSSFMDTGRGTGIQQPEVILPGDPEVPGAIDQDRFIKQTMMQTEDIARSEVQ